MHLFRRMNSENLFSSWPGIPSRASGITSCNANSARIHSAVVRKAEVWGARSVGTIARSRMVYHAVMLCGCCERLQLDAERLTSSLLTACPPRRRSSYLHLPHIYLGSVTRLAISILTTDSACYTRQPGCVPFTRLRSWHSSTRRHFSQRTASVDTACGVIASIYDERLQGEGVSGASRTNPD